jgi:hypothetical protein
MSRFRFRCLNTNNRRPLEAEVFVDGVSWGFTPILAEGWLEGETSGPGPVAWYAVLWNARVAKGVGSGGDFEILVDEKHSAFEARPSDFDLEMANPPPAPR